MSAFTSMMTAPVCRVSLECPADFLDARPASGGTWEITDIQVGSERRKGRGTELVKTLVAHVLPKDCRLLWAVTRAENAVAQQFYARLGFRVVAVLYDFYDRHGRSDAVMYGKELNP
jgi:ribosomal protein S18 acetylase RimI-like enzyme